MTSSDLWDAGTAARYDETSAGMFTAEVLDPTVDFLARLAGDGAALELAIGTGRVGVPLRARGVPVTGIELSAPMVEQLRRKVGEDELPVTVGDMATTRVPGAFSLVYLVYNTIGNLRTQAEQVACFRNAARHLAPGGRFVIEVGVPPLRRLPPGQAAVPFDVSERHLGFDTFDLVDQQGTSHHYWPGEGGTVALRRAPLPVRLAGRVRPDGAAGRPRAGAAGGGLGRQPVHLRQRAPRLGLAQADRVIRWGLSASIRKSTIVTHAMISAVGLRKSFGDFEAVKGIDVEVRKGEAFGFLGPNGAGKSSTMRMIAAVSPVGARRAADPRDGPRGRRAGDPRPAGRVPAGGHPRQRAQRLRQPLHLRPLLRHRQGRRCGRAPTSCWSSCR